MLKKLTAPQIAELAKCYMMWVGFTEDDIKSELPTAKSHVKEILKNWRKKIPKESDLAPEPPVWKGYNR